MYRREIKGETIQTPLPVELPFRNDNKKNRVFSQRRGFSSFWSPTTAGEGGSGERGVLSGGAKTSTKLIEARRGVWNLLEK